MTFASKILRAQTTHTRLGKKSNTFSYKLDLVLLECGRQQNRFLFGHNARSLFSINDADHGGPVGSGKGHLWAQAVFQARGMPMEGVKIFLLTQPKVFGLGFNPVSFWLAIRNDELIAAIAEVNNTYGDRHSYFCAREGFSSLTPEHVLSARKVMHVSPFQDVAGSYSFQFKLDENRLAVRIRYQNKTDGVIATLAGDLRPITTLNLLWSALRRPLTPVRTITLIHWQALKLYLKRVPFRDRPEHIAKEVT